MSCSPSGRGKFCGALEWCVCKSWKDVGEVITDGDVEPAAAFNNGEDGCDAWAGVLAADMDPVGSAQGDGTHRVLGEIVAQFQFWIVEESVSVASRSPACSCEAWPAALLGSTVLLIARM